MLNKAMERKLAKGECLDVSTCPRNAEGDYILKSPDGKVHLEFVDGKDYADAKREAWIFSIGKSKATGAVVASLDGRFYQNPRYDCIWLR